MLGWGEGDLLARRLNDLTLLSPPSPKQLVSSPAIARVICDAIDADQPELALALIELGADPNVLHPIRQATALVVAAERGNAEAIKYATPAREVSACLTASHRRLCAAGASQQVAGARETPAEAAQRCNHPQIVRLLQTLRK